MASRVWLPATLAIPAAFAIGGCDLAVQRQTSRATDRWTQTYSLADRGELRVVNTNGIVDVQGVAGSMVEVTADRIARGTSDQAARELLPRIRIREEIKPDRVTIETERIAGLLVGVSAEVQYHVRAPEWAAVRVETTNGRITIAGIGGPLSAKTTNGGVTAREISGRIEASATNGPMNVALAAVAEGGISISSTNGPVTLTVPDGARADVSAKATNGGIRILAPGFEPTDEMPRHVEGRLNGGGPSIVLSTTNGPIRVISESGAPRRGQ